METLSVEKSLIDAYPAYVAMLDIDGNILCVNRAWEERSENTNGFFGREFCDDNYFDHLARAAENGNDYALKLILGLRQVLENNTDFAITYPVSDSTEKNWYKVTIRPIDEEGKNFLVVHEDVSKLIKTSAALKETQERYKQQFMESGMAILIGKPDGEIMDANPAAKELLGYTLEELLRLNRKDVLDLEDPETVEAVKKRAETGEYSGELIMIDKPGNKVSVELTSKTYRNETGHLRTLTMFKDISAKKEMEDKLDTEKRFNETALNSLPGLFVLLDENSQLVRFNNGFTDELGFDDPSDMDKSIYDIIIPEDHLKVESALEKVRNSGFGEVKLTLLGKKGDKHIYKFRARRFISKNQVYIVATGIDITENIRIEREKNYTYELMAQLFNNSPIGIVLSDKENRAERVNEKFVNMFGYTESEIIGNRIDDKISPPDLIEAANKINSETFNGTSTQIETVRVNKKGEEIPVLLGTVPVTVDAETVAAYGIYIDISERIKLEQQISELFEKEKKARKDVEKSKIKLEEIFVQSPSSIALLEGEDFRFIMANSSYNELISRDDIMGKKIEEVLPELSDQGIIQTLKKVYTTGEPYIAKEELVKLYNGDGVLVEHYLNYTCKPIYNNAREVYGLFIEAVDVTELVNSRIKVQNSLKEKEILLQEVHHRVKNNLAVITGLMDLQMMDTDDTYLNPKLKEVQGRIFSIAQIHEAIYQQEDVVRVKFNDYLNYMVESWKQDSEYNDIDLKFEFEDVDLNLNQAVSCGLLTNELMNLVGNSNNGKGNKAMLTLVQAGDMVEIGVENQQFGISGIDEIEKAEKFNLKIIQVLLNQLSATYRFENGNSKKLIIRFKKADVKGSSSSFI